MRWRRRWPGFTTSRSNFADANRLVEAIVRRDHPPPPWWALNRYGMCQKVLGFLEKALAAFERALPVAPSRKDEGTTLNNISQIYNARGDYEGAEVPRREPRDPVAKSGTGPGKGTTLNNITDIAQARGDYGTR